MQAAGHYVEGIHYEVDSATGCWNWLRCEAAIGYGGVNCGQLKRRAHRVFWENRNGPIPYGLCVCHTCDNRKCVNPDHLWLGTRRQNMQDAMSKGRFSPPPRNTHLVGDRCPWIKLTESQITDIRATYQRGKPFVASPTSSGALARKYGVHRNHILDIVRGDRRQK